MATEKEIIEALTDKLVKVAKWPNQRMHFTVAWLASSTTNCEVHFYKDEPKMSNVQNFMLIHYYSEKLTRVKNDEKAQVIIDKCSELLKQMSDRRDQVRAASMLYMHWNNYLRKRDAFEEAVNICYHWLESLVNSPDGANTNVLNEFLAALYQKGDLQWLIDIIIDCNQYINEQKKAWEKDKDYERYVDSVYDYVCSKEELLDEEDKFILTAILQIEGIIELPIRERNKKGSFDYNYAKAEKGDKEYQLLVAKAYREGDGVPKNIRLANLWEGFANNKIVE